MDFTTDKLRSLVKKWQSLIEPHVDVKTTHNYTLRMFCIGFTKKRANQVKTTCYAQSSQIRQVKRKLNGHSKKITGLPFLTCLMFLSRLVQILRFSILDR